MAIDFEQEYGVNAGYVQELFDDWKADPAKVAEIWQKIFERVGKESSSRAGAADRDRRSDRDQHGGEP